MTKNLSQVYRRQLPLIAALGTVIIWSFAFPASKAALSYFSIEQVVLLRYLTACLFYLALFIFGKFKLPGLRDIPLIAIMGLLGVTVYQLLFVFGMGRVAGGAAAMIITANPVVSSLLARFFLSEKLSAIAWCGIFISLGGVAIISFFKGTDGDTLGFLALICAVIVVSIFFVFQKPFFKRYTPLAMTSYTSFAGTIPLLIFLPDTIQSFHVAPIAPILWVVTMGIFSSGIGFIWWFYALSKLPAGIVTSTLFLQPVFVTAISWAWLGEMPEVKTYVGGMIVLIGVALILKEQFNSAKSR